MSNGDSMPRGPEFGSQGAGGGAQVPPPNGQYGYVPPQGSAQGGYQSGPYQFTGMEPQSARQWAVVSHLAGPLLYLLSFGTVGFFAPLIMWLIFKDRDPLVRRAAAGAFNFSFLLLLVSIGVWILTIITLGLGFFLLPLIFFAHILFAILGSLAANKGQSYTYPVEIPILK